MALNIKLDFRAGFRGFMFSPNRMTILIDTRATLENPALEAVLWTVWRVAYLEVQLTWLKDCRLK
jgi:hypothetical protein